MISYPPPKFEQQKSEILQRYQILRGDNVHNAVCLADSMAMSLRVPVVHVALYQRYRARYGCSHGLAEYSAPDIKTYFSRMHLAQGPFQVRDIKHEDYFQADTGGLALPEIRALAGIPLTDPNGKRFGTLCIADLEAREFSTEEMRMLSSFARVVSNDICVRSAAHYALEDLLQLEKKV